MEPTTLQATEPARPKPNVAALIPLIGSLLLTASLVSFDPADPPSEYFYPANPLVRNWCGPIGARTASWVVEWFGIASLLFCSAGFSLTWRVLRRRSALENAAGIAGFSLLILAAAPLLQPLPTHDFLTPVAGPGGIMGLLLANALEAKVSRIGTVLVLAPIALTGAVLADDPILWLGILTIRSLNRMAATLSQTISTLARRWRRPVRLAPSTVVSERRPGSAATDLSAFPPPERTDDEPDVTDVSWEHPRQELRIVRNGVEPMEPAVQLPAPVVTPPPPVPSNVELPGLEILDEPTPFDYSDQEGEIRERALVLERTFTEFQMKVKVVQIDTGPVVTQYEIELEPGLRARKVMAMSDDLAIALRAPTVRIVAPIPGKNTVGIEVPNARRAKVAIKEVFTKATAAAASMRLPLYLGKDVKGQPLVCDLAMMPHLLIAGRTGTGKSVCLNALILSVLMSRTPDQVKMLMIDPKMVELSLYKDIPHLLHPVVTDMRKAEALLAWAVEKMEERYDLLARVGVRHIDSYNKLSKQEICHRLGVEDESERTLIPTYLPYILIFADEMADLMMTAAKEVEGHIIRLAQKSRAVGIHLVLATQKPTVDVITGLIKSNLPARIAFQVSSRTDSRVVLDEMGADKLLGNGDMLFLYPGTSKIIRAQGTYVSDEEVTRVTSYLCSQAKPQYSQELMQLQSAGRKDGQSLQNLSDRDELYEQAIDVIVREQRGSVSLLQRALGIGYGRGARLIDFMAEDGIVGDYNGSQAREVLYTIEQWEELKRTRWGKTG